MTVAIVGLGLIGGSFAKALKAKTAHRVLGCDASQAVLEQALACGAVDAAIENFDFSQADLTLVALYPAAAVDFLRAQANSFKKGSLVIDLCGVKRSVCAQAEKIFAERNVTFIGGHPMAGRECFGFENAVSTLFEGASMILTPNEQTPEDCLAKAGAFFREVGFTNIEITTTQHHDEMIAYTSQLAHIVSSAYVKSPQSRGFMGFSAGSFADMTRVAKLNESMWTELFLHNGDYLAQQIQVIIDNLADFKAAIEEHNANTLQALLRDGREIKEKLEQKENAK